MSERLISRILKDDEFMNRYIADIANILELGSKGDYKVLLSLARRASFDTNEVRVMRDVKLDICKETGLTMNSINKVILNLGKKEVLLKKIVEGKPVRGVYKLNPKFFFEQGILEQNQVVKIILEYKKV